MTRSRNRRLPASEPVSVDDAELFRSAIGSIKRLESDAAERRAPPPPPIPLQSQADERAVRDELLRGPAWELEWSEPMSYVRQGASPRLLRKLGRGEFSVRDEIDLHEMTVPVATSAIAQFLGECLAAGRLCVKIIHGKGLRSKSEGPVLKRLTDKLLRQRGDVLAFRSARPSDGGTGAVIVLLRARS